MFVIPVNVQWRSKHWELSQPFNNRKVIYNDHLPWFALWLISSYSLMLLIQADLRLSLWLCPLIWNPLVKLYQEGPVQTNPCEKQNLNACYCICCHCLSLFTRVIRETVMKIKQTMSYKEIATCYFWSIETKRVFGAPEAIQSIRYTVYSSES